MQEILQSLSICFLLGIFVGFAYTRGACLTLSLYGFVGKSMLVLVALLMLGLYFEWQKLGFSSTMALGISTAVLVRLSYLKLTLPWQLQRKGRPGEEEPGIGVLEGLWTLSYSNGQTVSYDRLGKMCRIGFPDGSCWELSDDNRSGTAVKERRDLI